MFWLKVFFTLISFIQIGFHKKTRSFFIHLCIYENAEKGGGAKLGPRYFGGGFCVDGAGVWWREAHFFLKDRKKVVILKFVIIICCCFF